MKSFRFIHTGDIHLDSPLKGLSGQQGAAAERIRTATRVALDNLVGQAIEEQVAFVIIAGDLYDGDWRDYQTGLFFVKQMGRLAQVGIPVFLLYGNHDAKSQITRRLTLPVNVKVFSARRPDTFRLENCDVALHGQSYRQRDITENLVNELNAALAYCKKHKGTKLIVATLSRLTRDTRFLLTLIDGSVDVVFTDLPQVPPGAMGRFFLTMMAAVAEFEAGLSSERTKAALAQVKARGEKKLGNPTNLAEAQRRGAASTKAAADQFAGNCSRHILR